MDKKFAVVFDLDGTLLDTLDDITDSINYVMAAHGFAERTKGEVRSFVGNGAKKLVERAMYSQEENADRVSDPDLVEQCYNEFREYYNQNSNVKTAPYAGLASVLEKLYASGIPMAVVSNKPDATVKELCEYHFEKYIKIAIGDKEGQKRKPDPTVLLNVINDLGCDGAIYIGDSEVDVQVAKNAGIPSVIMTWGFRDRQIIIENGAEILANDASELMNALSRLTGINFGDL